MWYGASCTVTRLAKDIKFVVTSDVARGQRDIMNFKIQSAAVLLSPWCIQYPIRL